MQNVLVVLSIFRNFLHPAIETLGPTQPPVKWVLVLCPTGTAAEAWGLPPIPI